MQLESAQIKGVLTKEEVEEALKEYLFKITGKECIELRPKLERVYEDDDYPSTKFDGYIVTLKG